MTTVEALLTADEFAALPEPLEGGKMELMYGRVLTRPPFVEEESNALGAIFTALRAAGTPARSLHIRVGYLLARHPDLLRVPDLAFTFEDTLDPNRDRSRYIDGPPNLAVEVVSPGDRDSDLSEKVVEYLEAGARRVWVVRPRLRTVTVHRPGGDAHTHSLADTLTSHDAGFEVEGFELPLQEIFS